MKKQLFKKIIIFLLVGLMVFATACDGPTDDPFDPADVTTEENPEVITEEPPQSEISAETTAEATSPETSTEEETTQAETTQEETTVEESDTELSPEYDAGRVDCSTLDTESTGFAVVDENGKCYIGRNELEQFRPASVTKVLTALVAVEKLNLDDVIAVSEKAVSDIAILSSGVSPSLKPGEKFTVRDMLYALILPSTNAAANVLAEAAAGNKQNFAAMMNQKAKEIGCLNSNFVNPHGLDETGHLSCPYDMALILKTALENETLRTILSAKTYEMSATEYNDVRQLQMGHAMVSGTYPCAGVYAGKTGSTVLAGKTLVTAVERGGKKFFICTMHSMENHQYMDTDNIIRYAYAKWTKTKTNLLAFAYDVKMTTTDGLGMTFTYKVSNIPGSIVNATWPLSVGTAGAKFKTDLTMNREQNTLSLSGLDYGTYAVQFLVKNAAGEESGTLINVLHSESLFEEGVVSWKGANYLLDAGNIVNVGIGETTTAAYYANPDGTLKKGLVGGRYYAGDDFRIITGWQKVGEENYYFQPDGRMATGKYPVDGDVYDFANDGTLIDIGKEGVGE